jgi:hypothetical protein
MATLANNEGEVVVRTPRPDIGGSARRRADGDSRSATHPGNCHQAIGSGQESRRIEALWALLVVGARDIKSSGVVCRINERMADEGGSWSCGESANAGLPHSAA